MTDSSPHDDTASHGFKVAKFQADSALLRELGERLVGQPHIALAELIKNAYDADATLCTVSIADNQITVSDNGHGMTEAEFIEYWMTIGTQNKLSRDTSPTLRRRVTGSKGVGRLSAQFLAHKLEIVTSSKSDPSRQLRALVNWDDAVSADSLTEAEARYKTEPRESSFPKQSPHGTRVVMTEVKQQWDIESTRNLGRQLWMLQPPPSRYGSLVTHATDPDDFRITLTSKLGEVKDTFDQQMKAMLRNHMAEISGELKRDGDRTRAHVRVTFQTGERYSESFDVEPIIASAEWLIRIFKLSGKQAGGIDVATARAYFERFGGVTVYDGRFRLPYYGAEQDWLKIEFDHSHRRSRSVLLPDRLHVPRALNDLPTQGRLFGLVAIDTGLEAQEASDGQKERGEFLKIQVTRDRLVSNESYQVLRRAVRWSLDYYATRQRLKEQQRAEAKPRKELATEKVDRVRSLLVEAHESYPQDETIAELRKEVEGLSGALGSERRAEERARMLLGPLAAAGMAALALEHESRKEMRSARQMLSRLTRIGQSMDAPRVIEIGQQIGAWIDRLEETRKLFGPLLDLDDREEIGALAAAPVLQQVVANVRPLVPGMRFSLSIPSDLYLPPATFAEWNSLFQNVIFNASNATLDLTKRKVLCSGGRTGRGTWIRIEDNGAGVDYADSAGLFEPFARHVTVSEERRALGLGGMGLGLTIVRMIASQRRARVAFVKPSPGWATAFQLSWSSSK